MRPEGSLLADGGTPRDAARAALAPYLSRLWVEERELASAFQLMASRHDRDPDMRDGCRLMAEWSSYLVGSLSPFVERYGSRRSLDAEHVRGALFHGSRWGEEGLLRDAQDLALLVEDVKLGWTALAEAAPELRDRALAETAKHAQKTTQRQLAWLETRIKYTAPSALTTPPDPIESRRGSIPRTLLPATLPPATWGPLACGLAALAIGLLGAAFRVPLLAASLGASLYLQALEPAKPSAHARNVVLGHVIGLAAGLLWTVVFGLWRDPAVLTGAPFTLAHALAAALALATTVGAAYLAQASHPPAGATTLLVVLGALHGRWPLFVFLLGLAIVAAVGEGLRWLRTRTVPARRT